MALSVCTKREKRKVKHVSLKVAHVSTENISSRSALHLQSYFHIPFFSLHTVFEDDPDFAQLYISPRVSSPARLFRSSSSICGRPALRVTLPRVFLIPIGVNRFNTCSNSKR